MIVRAYRCRVAPERAKDYESFERKVGVPMVARQPGCLHVGFGRVEEASEPTFLFVSVWRDRKSLDRARASPAWKDAVDRLEAQRLTLDEGSAEHVALARWTDGAVRPRVSSKRKSTRARPSAKKKARGRKR